MIHVFATPGLSQLRWRYAWKRVGRVLRVTGVPIGYLLGCSRRSALARVRLVCQRPLCVGSLGRLRAAVQEARLWKSGKC